MSTLNYVFLTLVLSSCLDNHVVGSIKLQPNAVTDVVQVSIQAQIPLEESPLHIICAKSSGFDIPPARCKTLTVPSFGEYNCDATWKSKKSSFKKASFIAYDKTRDTTQKAVYWLIDPLAFYESYDQRDWKRMGGWE
ncbi:hypothetical protein Lal_00026335 [Lupinus albus]|nr:hypothetical protein Lal_00026335 [Lupinus albus]